MKVAVGHRTVVVIGKHRVLPPLLDPAVDRDEILVLAIGPRVSPEQQRAVEVAISTAVDHRIPFEARIATLPEAAMVVAAARAPGRVRTYGCSRHELHVLGVRDG
jgi:hypothetical protein